MKFELIDKKDRDFSFELAQLNNENKKKDELKALNFIFCTAEKKYWLQNFPDENIKIDISIEGTMDVSKTDSTEISPAEKQKIDAVVKHMYGLLGVKEAEYHISAETPPSKGIATGSAGANPGPLPATKNYHAHLTTHADALNAALKPHHYQVNSVNNTLEKLDVNDQPTGHKIAVNTDGSTKGDLYSNLKDSDVVASLIFHDHVAVINMHLALLQQGIQPTKKINLFLIKENLSAEDKAKLPAIEAKIKEFLTAELNKPAYDTIRDFIVYDGVPFEKKAAAVPKQDQPEPPRPKNFEQKIIANEDTGNMWLVSNNVIEIPTHVLQKYRHDFTRVQPADELILNSFKTGDGSKLLPKPYPAYLVLNENNNHFVLVWADKENNLHYYNSMSGNVKAKEDELRSKFPGFASYEVEYSNEQTEANEAWTCGYRVARKILELESENDPELQKHPLVQAKTPKQIRDAFVDVAKDCYVHKIQLKIDTLFEDLTRSDNTQPGKLQYYEISETRNKPFFEVISKVDATQLKEAIKKLCESDPKFRHALIETAPHYIYYNNGEDNRLGVGENGLGKNDMGMVLMDVRNELFSAKDSKHPLIVDTKALRVQANKERTEVDVLLGDDNTEGKSIIALMRLVREAQKPKTETDVAPRSPGLGAK